MDLIILEQEAKAKPKPSALAELSDKMVFGTGNVDAKLIIVGEAPGEEEDKQGLPFVGRAGQLLDRILESVDLHRNDIYITNIVKYRPPGNRNPTNAEIAASDWLILEQIKIIRPQIIATLGNISTQYFINTKEGITKTRGKWFDWHSNIRILPLFHPAYLLRNPSKTRGAPKWLMWEDMKMLKAELDLLGPKPAKVVIDSAQQESLFS